MEMVQKFMAWARGSGPARPVSVWERALLELDEELRADGWRVVEETTWRTRLGRALRPFRRKRMVVTFVPARRKTADSQPPEESGQAAVGADRGPSHGDVSKRHLVPSLPVPVCQHCTHYRHPAVMNGLKADGTVELACCVRHLPPAGQLIAMSARLEFVFLRSVFSRDSRLSRRVAKASAPVINAVYLRERALWEARQQGTAQ